MSSNGPKVGQKKKFELPHIFAILFAIIIICTILTWIIPAGTFDYVENEDGRNIAVAGTWHPVDDVDPVGPFRMLGLVYEGMIDAADIIFLIFITYASTTFIIKSGSYHHPCFPYRSWRRFINSRYVRGMVPLRTCIRNAVHGYGL